MVKVGVCVCVWACRLHFSTRVLQEDICHEGPNKEVWLLDRRLLAVPAELLRHCWDQGLLLARKEGDAPDETWMLRAD